MLSTHLQEIQQKGYTRIPQLYDPSLISDLKNKVVQDYEANRPTLENRTDVPFLNRGHQMIYNLQNKNLAYFRPFLQQKVLRSILINCLNDEWYRQIPSECPNFILRSLLARSSGNQDMPLHIDSFIPNTGNYIWIMQAAIILEDQNQQNGCTRVIPGSHQFGRYVTQDEWVNAIPIESQAGDVVLWDSRLWHGASGNTTSASRWSIIATFGRWWIKQNYDIPGSLPHAFFRQLNDEEKSVLGFCSIPPKDEYDRLDIKAGYEILI